MTPRADVVDPARRLGRSWSRPPGSSWRPSSRSSPSTGARSPRQPTGVTPRRRASSGRCAPCPPSCRVPRSASPSPTWPSASWPSPRSRVSSPARSHSVGMPGGAVDPIAVAIGLTISTLVTIVFAELVPKNLAIARPMETARATQGFQRLFTAVMRGPIHVLNGSANAIVRRLGMEPQEELRSARSSTELASLISPVRRRGHPRRRHRRAHGAVRRVRHAHSGRDHDPAGAHGQPGDQRPRLVHHRAGPGDRSLDASRCSTATTRSSAPSTSSTPWR